jgi:hypothetical protein
MEFALRTLLRLTLLSMATLLSTAAGALAAEPESYPLVCRGAADLAPAVEMMAGTPSAATLAFKKGSRPATSGLAPGECSWVDRGLREDEPARLRQGVWSPGTYSVIGSQARETPWFDAIRQPITYWTFLVYNDKHSESLVVTDSHRYEEKLDGPIARPDVAIDVSALATSVAPGAERPGDTTAPDIPLPSLEPDTDRPGGDYRSFAPAEARPEACQRACAYDVRCHAYTYVKPGVQGPRPTCWLKSSIQPATASDCCVSGFKKPAAW